MTTRLTPAPPTAALADVYERAAALVKTNGHYAGDFYPGACTVPESEWPLLERPLNVEAAIRLACEGTMRDTEASTRALHFAAVHLMPGEPVGARELTHPTWLLGGWEIDATQDEIVAALRRLADQARQGAGA